jgi:hypothetical protein
VLAVDREQISEQRPLAVRQVLGDRIDGRGGRRLSIATAHLRVAPAVLQGRYFGFLRLLRNRRPSSWCLR